MQYAAMNRKCQKVKSYKLYIYISDLFLGLLRICDIHPYELIVHVDFYDIWMMIYLYNQLLGSPSSHSRDDIQALRHTPKKSTNLLPFFIFQSSTFLCSKGVKAMWVCSASSKIGWNQNALSHQPNSRWRWPWIGGKANHNPPYSDTHRMGPSSYVCWYNPI